MDTIAVRLTGLLQAWRPGTASDRQARRRAAFVAAGRAAIMRFEEERAARRLAVKRQRAST